MSINMADVKQIINNANNKEVVKIQDSLGNIIWQKPTPITTITITLSGWLNLGMGSQPSNAGYVEYAQLTSLVSPTGNPDKFIILPASTVQAIKNHTYTTDQTITGLTQDQWQQNYRGNAYICYIQNNDLYCVGNTDNSTANDTPLGTTNDLTKFRMYWPNRYNATTTLVYINDTTNTGQTKWRFSNANYFINHTNYGYSQKVFLRTVAVSGTETITYNI